MLSFFIIFLIISFFFFFKKKNIVFPILVFLFTFSYFSQFLVGRNILYKDVFSIFNVLFIAVNVFLVIVPWSYSKIECILIKSLKYFNFLKYFLFSALFVNLLLNIIILLIVYTYIPSIAEFKAEEAFLKLYDQIPYFANVFRYAYVSQNLGYLAIPIFFYQLGKFDKKAAVISLVLSCSSLISGFAFYSRAQIFTFVLVFVTYFFLIKRTLPSSIKLVTLKYMRLLSVVIIFLFTAITVLRFSAMDYYGDRIPINSFIQDPILFSLFDYASQGFSNGFYQLENYNVNKNLYGEQLLRDLYQILNFFGVISWDSKFSQEKIDMAYNYDGGAFNGYTAQLVFNFGYILTLVISFIYFFIVGHMVKGKAIIYLESNFKIILFLFIPIVSIFYVGYPMLYFPLIFLLIVRILYKIKMLF